MEAMSSAWLTEAVKEVSACFSSQSEEQLHVNIDLHCTLSVQVDLQLCGQIFPLRIGEFIFQTHPLSKHL